MSHAGSNDLVPRNIDGRKEKDRNKTHIAKHPMAGFETVKKGRALRDLKTDNAARNRIVSIAAVWLANYCAEIDTRPERKYCFVRQGGGEKIDNSLPSYKFLKQLCGTALRTRASSTACLLRGNAKYIGYVNAKGESIRGGFDLNQ